tara:strand:- start:83 stop:502 length:420 start_codon:yes stop_codon:yes gene_type:complete
MTFLPAFNVSPGVSFLGISKSKAHCFTLAKKHYDGFIRFFELSNHSKYADVILIIFGKEYPARIRFVNLDQSKPRKTTLKRNWKPMIKIQFDWKVYQDTKTAISNLCNDSILKYSMGVTKTDQQVRFEHIGTNKFYLSV